ncbi:MAG: outer membrane beta-barrel family protein [Putridiphycobacter sp.]|nr:outer membrane beta-barrel family protein [Putridiphycobacter sp.]
MKVVFHLLIVIFTVVGHAQEQPEVYTIKGKTINNNNEPLPFVKVLLKSVVSDSIIAGTTSNLEGEYVIKSKAAKSYLEFSFVGYKTAKIETLAFKTSTINVPDIVLLQDNTMMNEVQVVGERSTTEFKLDKRVFNVGTDLTNSGASALEVLSNVPSVNVSIEGDVTLRGASGVQILINGKPSVLADDGSNALGTITADMISQVEVITNPSAKYQAEGSSGILNIILKKEEKKGINGSVSVNTGWPHNHSIGFSLNRRGEKFNVFTQLGAGYRSLPRYNNNINRDLVSGTELVSDGTNYRNEQFYNLILGTDYYLTKQDVITLSGSIAYEVEQQPSETEFSLLDSSNEIVRQWNRIESTEATNPKFQYELKYKRDFKDDKDHDLNFSFIGNYFGKTQSSDFDNSVILGSGILEDQLTSTQFSESRNTFNLDYVKPFKKTFTLETGVQYSVNDVRNNYQVEDEVAGVYTVNEGLTNTFEYSQNVFGAYGTGAYEKDKWGVKLGLRVEHTDLQTFLVNTNQQNTQKFINLFPSLHTSYKLNKRVSFQAGYSRRIYRPRLWDLNPFFNISNNFNIRTGNPNLLPEYTDSYEVGSIFIFQKTSFNFNVYDRYTTQVIEQISVFENGVNTYTPNNLGTRNTVGAELNFKYTPNKIVTFNGDVNYNIFVRKGTFDTQDFNFTSDQWQGKLTSKFKLNKKIDFELSGNYQSRVRTVQGVTSANVFADAGFRYKILNGKGVLNASVRDIFASRFRETVVDQEDFYLYSFGQRGRFITLGFSYGFGKGEAMQYSGARGGPRK